MNALKRRELLCWAARSISLVALLAPAHAIAGFVLLGEMTNADAPKAKQKTETYLEGQAVRLKVDGPTRPMVMVYRADRQVLWVIDESQKSYQEIGRKEIDAMGKAFAQIEAQLKQLPPEQRRAMEQMMKKQGMGGASEGELVWKKVKDGVKVGRFTTEQHAGHQGKAKKYEIWTTSPQALGIGNDAAPMKKMLEFTKSLTDKLPAPWRGAIASTQQTLANRMFSDKGVAVQVAAYEGAKQQSGWRLLSVEKKKLPGSLFEPPKGFKKLSLGLDAAAQ